MLQACPPGVTRSESYFSNYDTLRCIYQGKSTIRALRNSDQKLMFALWKPSEGAQSAINAQAFNECWPAMVLQEECSRRRLQSSSRSKSCTIMYRPRYRPFRSNTPLFNHSACLSITDRSIFIKVEIIPHQSGATVRWQFTT